MKNKKFKLICFFFSCKTPGCGAEMNSVNMLGKHYQERHANIKTPVCSTKNAETFRWGHF